MDKLKTIIKKLAERMNKLNIKWALVGTTNHLLQGMNVTPRDIDIIISYNDLNKVENVFSNMNYEIKDFPNGEAKRMTFYFEGFEAEVCADYEKGKYYNKRCEEGSIKLINIEGIQIPLFTLESEAECYRLTGREEKAEKIREFIKI